MTFKGPRREVKLRNWWGPILSAAYGLGLITGYSSQGGYLKKPYTIWWPQTFTGKRNYLFFAPVTSWGCVLRRHHWPTELKVLNGYCGKCVPWPCCGSIEYDHLADCPDEAALQASYAAERNGRTDDL